MEFMDYDPHADRQRAEEDILKVLDWMIMAGAEYDHEGYLNGDYLEEFLLGDIQYFMGEATCEAVEMSQEEIARTEDYRSQMEHHDFEIVALAALGAPFDVATLSSMVAHLQPTVVEKYISPSHTEIECKPVCLEVKEEEGSVNVWAVQRFKVGDVDKENFHVTMTAFVALAEAAQAATHS